MIVLRIEEEAGILEVRTRPSIGGTTEEASRDAEQAELPSVEIPRDHVTHYAPPSSVGRA
jgi:hypothetical protein